MPCNLCPLHESAVFTNCMPGRGPEQAEIMLVGQGPGSLEDARGVPFVGKSGKLLDEMLVASGYDPSSLFYTNATRCRPPLIEHKERAPTPDEINTCRRYLIDEVHRVKPRLIIALGDAALRALCKTSGISGKRGQALPLHKEFGYECEVWPTYHPAFVLRKLPVRATVEADFRKVRDQNLEQEQISWRWWFGREQSLVSAKVAYDIETYDEDGKITDKPTQIAVSNGVQTLVSVADSYPAAETAVRAYCVDDLPYGKTIISHFGWDFDDRLTGIQSDRDTAALAYLDDETQPLGLESLCVKYLGVRGWKEARNGAKLGSAELAEYNARDALYTLRLHDHLVKELGPRIKIADKILLPARLALNACSQRGLLIDGDVVADARLDFAKKIEAARIRCQLIVKDSELNPGSNRQVGQLLVQRGHELRKTDTGERAVDKGVLQSLDDEFARAVLEYRSAVKYDSTYGKPYAVAAASEDGRMHNEYTLIRTSTGRTSARRSNVQNLPRDLRGFLDNVAIADYASIEFRLAAWIAQEPTILAHYAANRQWDPHRYFASLFYEKPEDQVGTFGENSERQIAKSANFSQLFLGDDHTLIDYGKKMGIEVPPRLARAAHLFFRHNAFPGFIPWWNRILEQIKAQGYIESPTGRRRHFGEWRLLSHKDRLSVWREGVNFPVQSLAADLALLGLTCCHAEGLPINGFFHDAISFDTAGVSPNMAEAIRQCMVEKPLEILRNEFGVNITIPIEIEIKTQQKKVRK